MSDLAKRLAAFSRQAAVSGVTVHVHPAGERERVAPGAFLRKAILYACVAGGMIAAYSAGRISQIPEAGRTHGGKLTSPEDATREHYEQIRSQLKWVSVKYRGAHFQTLDAPSRLLLSKAAAERANLSAVGLSFKDVYGLINAETSWIPREGASKNGTPNEGIAQFEPATARALGVVDPLDPVEAVHVAAKHMKDAAIWAGARLAGQQLDSTTRAQRIREGVSIYYNLSTKGRKAWDGKSITMLPEETIAHIQNAKTGAREAALLETRQVKDQMAGRVNVVTAGLLRGEAEPDQPDMVRVKPGSLQLSEHPAAAALRKVVQWPCKATSDKISGADFSAACVNSMAFRSHDPFELAQAFSQANMTLVGEAQGVPVMLVDFAGFEAVSMVYGRNTDQGRKPMILVTTGLVDRLAGPDQQAALSFVIGHELGHLKHSHTLPGGEGPLAMAALNENETAADFYGFQHMIAEGMDLEQIRGGIQLIMQEIWAMVSAEKNLLLMAVARHRIGHLERVLQNATDFHEKVLADAARDNATASRDAELRAAAR